MEHVLEAAADQAGVTSNLEGHDAFVRKHAQEAVDLDVAESRLADGMVHNGSRHVHTAGHLDALQTRAGVDFEHHRAVVALKQIDASDVEAEHAGCASGHVREFFGKVHGLHGSVEVEV